MSLEGSEDIKQIAPRAYEPAQQEELRLDSRSDTVIFIFYTCVHSKNISPLSRLRLLMKVLGHPEIVVAAPGILLIQVAFLGELLQAGEVDVDGNEFLAVFAPQEEVE